MKKLFAALASAALVGTVFAQTGTPASTTQPQGEATKDHVAATKGKADVHVTPHKSASKTTHHKTTKSTKAAAAKPEANMPKTQAMTDPETSKSKAMTPTSPVPQRNATKAASVDKTKKQ